MKYLVNLSHHIIIRTQSLLYVVYYTSSGIYTAGQGILEFKLHTLTNEIIRILSHV